MRILIIDDEELFREETAAFLRDEGFTVQTAEDGEEGLDVCEEFEPAVILCDIRMPGMDGLEVLEEIQDRFPDIRVIMNTAHGSLDTAVNAFREGAYDYILKPMDFDELLERMNRLQEEIGLREEVEALRDEVSEGTDTFGMVGDSEEMQEVYDIIEKVAPTDANVFIQGESGTGKELVARAIHNRRFSAGRRFVPVNCAALSESLLESELFGHKKGAFTGATEDKQGLFEAADGGTLFLDEISEMPPALQSKLLRAIENNEITRVGSSETIQVNPRILSASNQNCKELVKKGEFRDDLYYRLNVMEITIPPLRDRREDIPELVSYFIDRYSEELNTAVGGIEKEALEKLMLYDWPGNVRELENLIERAIILRGKGTLKTDDFPPQIWEEMPDTSDRQSLKEVVSSFERAYIQSVLQEVDGNREQAAERLDIDRSTLYRKLNE